MPWHAPTAVGFSARSASSAVTSLPRARRRRLFNRPSAWPTGAGPRTCRRIISWRAGGGHAIQTVSEPEQVAQLSIRRPGARQRQPPREPPSARYAGGVRLTCSRGAGGRSSRGPALRAGGADAAALPALEGLGRARGESRRGRAREEGVGHRQWGEQRASDVRIGWHIARIVR